MKKPLMRKILHLKDYDQLQDFITQVHEANHDQRRFDLYWNKELGWLWTTEDPQLFDSIVQIYKDRNWPEILPPAPEPKVESRIVTIN